MRDLSKKQVRAYQVYNKVLGGILIRQTKVSSVKCDEYYDNPELESPSENLYQDDCHPADLPIAVCEGEACWEGAECLSDKKTCMTDVRAATAPLCARASLAQGKEGTPL